MKNPTILSLALLAYVPLGCGRPATVEECEDIVARIAELGVKGRDADASGERIAQEVKAAKQDLTGATMSNCVGKRITDRALRCIREAKSYEELERGCF